MNSSFKLIVHKDLLNISNQLNQNTDFFFITLSHYSHFINLKILT